MPTNDLTREISIITKTAAPFLKDAALLKIKSLEQLEQAVIFHRQIKTLAKNIEETKQRILQPLRLTEKEIRNMFAEPENQVAKAEETVSGAILAYRKVQAQKAADKAAKIQQKIDEGTTTLAQGVAMLGRVEQPQTSIKTIDGGVQVRKIRKVRIISLADIPPHYFTDERVLKALELAVKKDALDKGVPGIEVYEEEVLASTGV